MVLEGTLKGEAEAEVGARQMPAHLRALCDRVQ